jgi:hypothetical protein
MREFAGRKFLHLSSKTLKDQEQEQDQEQVVAFFSLKNKRKKKTGACN